jgi:hypothetical protein
VADSDRIWVIIDPRPSWGSHRYPMHGYGPYTDEAEVTAIYNDLRRQLGANAVDLVELRAPTEIPALIEKGPLY